MLSSFSRIYDCSDIVEELSVIWGEDLQPLLEKSKFAIEAVMTRTKETISKLYPVLYSEEFKALEHNSTSSAVGDNILMDKRKLLIQSALRFGATYQPKVKVS